MSTKRTFKFFMTNFAPLIIKNWGFINSSLNDREAFSKVFQGLSHLTDSSFRIYLWIRRIELFRVILCFHFLVESIDFWKNCADQDKCIICQHFYSKSIKAYEFSQICLWKFLIPNSNINKSILSKSFNEGECELTTIFLFFLRSSYRNNL